MGKHRNDSIGCNGRLSTPVSQSAASLPLHCKITGRQQVSLIFICIWRSGWIELDIVKEIVFRFVVSLNGRSFYHQRWNQYFRPSLLIIELIPKLQIRTWIMKVDEVKINQSLRHYGYSGNKFTKSLFYVTVSWTRFSVRSHGREEMLDCKMQIRQQKQTSRLYHLQKSTKTVRSVWNSDFKGCVT